MDTANWSAIQRAFDEVSLLTGKQRERALAQLKAEDEPVYQEVIELLSQESKLHHIFNNNPFGEWGFFEDEGLLNSQIGPYRLTQLLGYGGMGSVFLAAREDKEFEQEVAIKLVRPRKYSEATINRFKEERQILAQLHHPSIATLYDGGSMEDGRMYFTMEYLPWSNLEAYIEENNPSLEERLSLFKRIAAGIAYAHSQLVLHLDIKPKNILVGPDGTPKILDFGISQRFFSEKEALKMSTDIVPSDNRYTMAFASPEQLNKKQLSTQSDIYSLGGLLYYLISDNLPFGKNDTTREAYLENVMSGKFIPPSLVQKNTAKRLSSDMDAICKKTLALKPEDRYASVDQLIRDIKAYEKGYPISIREQENFYSLNKYINRNRTALSLAGIFLITLLGLTFYYTTSLATQRNIAIKESERSQQLMSFMSGIFSSANPYENQGDTISVGNYLEKSLLKLDEEFPNQPSTKAELLITLGQVYEGLNNYEKGDSLFEAAHTIIQAHPEIPNNLLIQSLYELANSKHDIGEYDLSIQLTKKTDSLYQIEKLNNKNNWDPLFQGRINMLQSNNYDINGQYATADSILTLTYPLISNNVTPPNQELADLLLMMGSTKRHRGEFDLAEKYYKECLAQQEQLHQPPNSEIAITLNHFASLHYNKGEYDKGIEYGERSYAQRLKIFGKNHRETMASLSNLARNYTAKGDYDNALARYKEIMDILNAIYPQTHPYHLAITSATGKIYRLQGDYDNAMRYYDQAGLFMKQLGQDNNHKAQMALLGGKALVYQAQKQYKLAKSFFEESLVHAIDAYGPDHHTTGSHQFMLGKCLWENGKQDEAKTYLEKAEKNLSLLKDKYKKQLEEIAEMMG